MKAFSVSAEVHPEEWEDTLPFYLLVFFFPISAKVTLAIGKELKISNYLQ